MAASVARAGSASFFDLEGHARSSLSTSNHTATVLVFIQPDCPISNQYAPTLERLREDFAPRKVAFRLVYPDKDVTAARARRHLKDYRLSWETLLDPQHVLVDQTGVGVTPECVVLDTQGKQRYRGRIDNRYVDFGKKRPQPTRHDLKEALEAVLTGKPVAEKETKAVGCYISKAETE